MSNEIPSDKLPALVGTFFQLGIQLGARHFPQAGTDFTVLPDFLAIFNNSDALQAMVLKIKM
jgi:hypothetical protein